MLTTWGDSYDSFIASQHEHGIKPHVGQLVFCFLMTIHYACPPQILPVFRKLVQVFHFTKVKIEAKKN